jgi:hypothetical protein
MNAKQFADLLVELNACSEAREWASGKSLAAVWKTCKRGDWLLWLCGKMADKPNWPTHKEVVLAACDCAELSLKHVPPGEERPRKCLETVRAWAAGNATIHEVRTARAAAYTAAAYYAAASYAAYAADSAAYAAYATDAAYAAAAADSAAYAAYAYAAHTKILAKCAVLIRKRLKVQDIR